MRTMRKPMSREVALSRLQALCAGSEQCRSDLRRKMSRWGLTPDDAECVIAQLVDSKFVDDARYARAFAHDKLMFNGWGKWKISQGLWAKGIDRTTIDEAIDEAIDPVQYKRKSFAIIKSRATGMERTKENHMKLLRFGAARGFEINLLVKIINSPRLWELPED